MCKGEVKKVSVRKGQHIFVFQSKKNTNISVTKVIDCPSITETYTLIEDELEAKVSASSSGVMSRFRSLFSSSDQVVHTNPSKETVSKSPTDDPSDKALLYISNGNNSSEYGTVFFDTEQPVIPNRMYHIAFEASKWDGPVAGMIYWNDCWIIGMKNNKIIFDFPRKQTEHPDIGTFLPKNKYIFETINSTILLCKSEKSSMSDTLAFLKNSFKAGAAGMDWVDKWKCQNPITLFKCGTTYAWQGLKISHFRVTDGKVVVADMIPVLHNGKACFWDKVRKQYFYNQGKGAVYYKEA